MPEKTGRTLVVALGLAIALVSVAHAQIDRGRVSHVDPGANVVVLDDGRMYRVTQHTVLMVDQQAVPVGSLRPGSVVVIRAGEAVVARDGQYVVAAAPAAAAPPPGSTAVVVAPPLKRTIYGKVTDVDRDGEITVKTDKGEFDMKLTPDSVRSIRTGDTVMIDVTFAPPGSPVR